MTDDDDITPQDFEHASKFKSELNYELILGKQINRVALFRDINIKQYASSIDTLIIMLPEELRNNARKMQTKLGIEPSNYDGMNSEKLKKWDELWTFINLDLEDHNLIFKTSTFEVGTETRSRLDRKK
jgi:hypothetical protein